MQKHLSDESMGFNLGVRKKLYKMSDTDYLTEEIVADAFGTILEKSDVLDQFVTEHRSAAQKIKDALHDLLLKIRRALGSKEVTLSENQRAAFRDLAGRTQEMEKLFADALETMQGKALQGETSGATMSETRYSAKAARGRTIELETMENNRFQRLRQFGDDLPAEWYAFTGTHFYIYSNQSYTDYTILAKARITQENRADIDRFIEEAQNGTFTGAETFDKWTASFRRGKGSDSWHRIRASKLGATQHNDGMDVRARGSEHSGNFEKSSGTGGVKFSLKSPVEETRDLLALHNAKESDIFSALKLGGLPMPSIAVVKAEAGHSKYGPISLVFNKASIDPQADSRNKVYGSDAYTPTAPQVDYRVNDKRLNEIEREIHTLAGDTSVADGIFGNSAVLRSMGINDVSTKDTAKLAEELSHTDTVRAAYLADNGETLRPVKQAKVWDKYGNDTLEKVIDRMGVQELAEIEAKLATGENIEAALGENADAVKDIIREHYREVGEPALRRMAVKKKWTAEEIDAKREERINRSMEQSVSGATLENLVHHAWEMYEDGGATEGEIDRYATRDALRESVNDSDVERWVAGKLDGLLSEAGIYNGKDPYTASGKSRSFSQLHYAYTLENIIKAMRETQKERGGQAWGANAMVLQAVTSPEYRSIPDIKADSGRLGTVGTDA